MSDESLWDYIERKQEELEDFCTWYWLQQYSQGEYMYPECMPEEAWDRVFIEQWKEQ